MKCLTSETIGCERVVKLGVVNYSGLTDKLLCYNELYYSSMNIMVN